MDFEEATLTVVGSGTLVPSATRGSAAHHLRTATASVLLDCGSGTLHGLARCGVEWPGLTHVVVSHFHNDHVGDVAGLLFAFKYGLQRARTEPLKLIGPNGLRSLMRKLREALGDFVLDPGFPLEILELEAEDRFEDDRLALSSFPTPHTAESVALSVEGAWGGLGYTGDTGPSPEVARFLAGNRIVIAECALADPPPTDLHLSPRGVARLARIAEPELLVVTHAYPPLDPDEAVARIAREYDGWTVAGADGLAVGVEGGRITVDRKGTPE